MTKADVIAEIVLNSKKFKRWYNAGSYSYIFESDVNIGVNWIYICSESIALELITEGLVVVEYDQYDDHCTYLKLLKAEVK